jgi:predicted Zn finger-like uncharacterized protein
MPVSVICPSCNARMRAPDSSLGRQVKCPRCQHTFVASADEEESSPPLPPPEEPEDFDDLDEPSRRRRSPASGDSGTLVDFLLFRRMIAPWVIQLIFWLGVVGCVGYGLVLIVGGLIGAAYSRDAGGGLLLLMFALFGGVVTMVLGPILVRLYCELLIVIFRINETLTDISNKLNRSS